jgi:hypothetical protein
MTIRPNLVCYRPLAASWNLKGGNGTLVQHPFTCIVLHRGSV